MTPEDQAKQQQSTPNGEQKSQELKHQELTNRFDSLFNQVSSLSNAIQSLSLKTQPESKPPPQKGKLEGWGNSLTIIVGILSGIAILFTQLKQPDNVNADTQEKLAAARKTNAEALKLEQEIQLFLDSVKIRGSKDAQAYNDLLEDKLPKLQNVISRFETSRAQTQNQNLLYKYIIIWVIFIGLGWFFRLFHTLWSNLLSLFSFYIDSRLWSNEYGEKKRKRLMKITRSLSFFYSVPTIIEIVIDINIFFILIVPIFNETSASLGSAKTFNSVSTEFTRFHIKSSIDSIKSIVIVDTLNTGERPIERQQ